VYPCHGKKNYPKKGINEIPEAIAQAYFLYGLPDEKKDDENEFAALQKHALLRWGVVLKSKPPAGEFLLQFILADTREGLEEVITRPGKG